MERVNRSVDNGEDVDYLKDPKFLQRISRAPFYGAEIRPATVCFTSFGMRIDRDAQVLGEAGPPIPGLFAAGESVGGVVGPRYVGSGNSYANCVTFGRIAGASARACSRRRDGIFPRQQAGGSRVMGAVTAALITGQEAVEYREFDEMPPSAGCVTIDIRLCGICGTDIASYRSGHLHSPAVCGHEWVGTISDIGPGVRNFDPGDRVVVAVPPACGRCPECRAGIAEYCRSVSAIARGRDELAPPHGGFARSITVAADRAIHAHPDLSDEEAAQVEPSTVAFHGVRRSRIGIGDTVVVQGAGPIGLLVMQFVRAAGAGQTIVVEPSARSVASWLPTSAPK